MIYSIITILYYHKYLYRQWSSDSALNISLQLLSHHAHELIERRSITVRSTCCCIVNSEVFSCLSYFVIVHENMNSSGIAWLTSCTFFWAALCEIIGHNYTLLCNYMIVCLMNFPCLVRLLTVGRAICML